MIVKLNERSWTGQVISWIQEEISNKRTIFQDATNDAGIKLKSGATKFPDILLFTDKISGVVFNGWELKFPDTEIDNKELLLNALEKAERIKSNSFVTWNGTEAIIWEIKNNDYSLEHVIKLKVYSKEPFISVRNDIANPTNYRKYENRLKDRLKLILHDLESLYKNGVLRQAINISGNFVEKVYLASKTIIPQFENEILEKKSLSPTFRNKFIQWKIYESASLYMLHSSSRRYVPINAELSLAKFSFYNLIGKIVFYITLSENLPVILPKLDIHNNMDIKEKLLSYFNLASKIDYQAIFRPYFTDDLEYSQIVNESLFQLISDVIVFDFKILPAEVIGTILENLIPEEEKQKFGQYFTPTILANIVAYPAIRSNDDYVFDPTSGSGTFLESAYHILNYYRKSDHSKLLNQIWGNDISHFPALLSVINLYKLKIKGQIDNFPRVLRDNFFNLEPGMEVIFPDSNEFQKKINISIPYFDAIVSNFPFIQQEDIDSKYLANFIKTKFGLEQKAFFPKNKFMVNERSDYSAYCIYNSLRFLKEDGYLSIITSNAWLGKDYGVQVKSFLLDNFHIKYIFKSNAEHWFKGSKVSTIFIVLQKTTRKSNTKFITFNKKLVEIFAQEDLNAQLESIDNFYNDIDYFNYSGNNNYKNDVQFQNLFHKTDGSLSLNVVSEEELRISLTTHNNWSSFFISANLLGSFEKFSKQLYPKIVNIRRGERTGWNKMFIIPSDKIEEFGISKEFLVPYLKSSSQITNYEIDKEFDYFLFVCDVPLNLLKVKFEGTYNWIMKFSNLKNKNGRKTIQQACCCNKPFWYSLSPKKACIISAVNPYERLFFSYSSTSFTADQRLVTLQSENNIDTELICALLNSVISYLTLELRGTTRNLGALDLNANYFKKHTILDPDLLTESDKRKIKLAFKNLQQNAILPIFEEIHKKERIHFDNTIFKAFGIPTKSLDNIYKLLTSLVNNRITIKDL